MVGTVCDFTEYEILVVYTNGGSSNITKTTPLKPPFTDIHINEYSMAKILLLKDTESIPGVDIKM